MRIVKSFDAAITNHIASWSANLKPFFVGITTLGDPYVVVGIGLVVATYGLFQTNARLAIAGITVWVTLAAGAVLKMIFERARPLTEYAAQTQTFSFPSGHTTGATIAYGLLAYLAWHILPQPWNYIVVGLLILLIILVGISRVYLGAHFPSDVVAGWALGIVGVLIIALIIKPLS